MRVFFIGIVHARDTVCVCVCVGGGGGQGGRGMCARDRVCMCFTMLCLKMLIFVRFVCLYTIDLYMGICAMYVFL